MWEEFSKFLSSVRSISMDYDQSTLALKVVLDLFDPKPDDKPARIEGLFDDAFAYSDPERVNQLQRMLDLAATRGLQIIVLTCNPADYAALGARQVILRPEPTPAHPGRTSQPGGGF